MKNLFVKYEQAVALKELGFNEPCFGVFAEESKLIKINSEPRNWNDNVINGETTSVPLYQQSFKFFREKHNVYSYVSKYRDNNFYHYDIFVDEIDEDGDESVEIYPCLDLYNTYEEAEGACLNKLIEIIQLNV